MDVPVPQYYTFRRGCVWKSEHGAMDPMKVIPAGRRKRRRRGKGCTPRRRPVELPLPACPKGVLRRIRHMKLEEQSGRTTGRLEYTWPTTTHAIGGTAALALRYSYHLRIDCSTHSLSVMTTGRLELLEHGHRRRIRWGRRTFQGLLAG